MKKTQRLISVFIVVTLLFSSFSLLSSAEEKEQQAITAPIAAELERDIPMIVVLGLGGQYYNGQLTETEEDDAQIWEPTMDMIVPVVEEYGYDLIKSVLKKDYVQVNAVIAEVANKIFGTFALNTDGTSDPDVAKKEDRNANLRSPNGYVNDYTFFYDWRLDVVTLADQLDEYVQQVMEVTGSDKVSFVATSKGNSILMTYLYKHFYTNENYADTNHVHSAVFVAGTMNGAATCQDPFTGNINLTAESIVRYVEDIAGAKVPILRVLYSLGIFEPVLEYVTNLIQGVADNGLFDAIENTLATIPGFHTIMAGEQYELAKELIYNTPEKQEKFATILAASDYYHNEVQPNNVNIIQKMLDNGIHAGILAQYGYNIMPTTSDNDRMSDGTIAMKDASFGATGTATDETFPADYVQAVDCICGKNHISPDRQIDASTCAFADITWFGRDMFHVFDDALLADLVDIITYSEEQITVHTYEELPQYLIRKGNTLVPLTEDNFGEIATIEESIANDEDTAATVRLVKLVIAAVVILILGIDALIIYGIVKCIKKRKAKKNATVATTA